MDEKIMDGLSKEIGSVLKAMSKTKDVNEKETYSRILKNLCDSLNGFLTLATEMMPYDYDDYDDIGGNDIDNEGIPF